MVTLHEGLGGWSIIIENGNQVMRLECWQFTFQDEHGITWFDLDRAMTEAKEINQQQQADEINASMRSV